MRYPEWNDTQLDTGIRGVDIYHAITSKDREAISGEYAVFVATLTRRADASTTEGDLWITGKSPLFSGELSACIDYISNYLLPSNTRLLYCSTGKIIYADIAKWGEYIDTLTPLCNDGMLLGDSLNYAAVVKNGYAPYAPGYDPDKRPVV